MRADRSKKRTKEISAGAIGLLQSVYMLILNFIFDKFTSKINEESRNKIILGTIIFYAAFIIVSGSSKITGARVGRLDAALVFTIVILMVIVLSVNGKLIKKQCNTQFCSFYFLTGILMLISCILNETKLVHEIYALQWLLLFPMLYFVWNNREDYSVLYTLIAKGFSYTGIIYFVLLLIAFPKSAHEVSGAYIGTTTNPNILGLIGCSIAISSLYLYMVQKKHILPLVTLCAGLGLAVMGESRTSLLAICFSALICIIYSTYYFIKKKYVHKNLFVKIIVGLIVVLISIPIFNMAFDFMQIAFAKSSNIFEKFRYAGDLNAFSTGRINLWQYCIENATFFGNDVGTTIPYNGTNYAGAHNSIVEMIYRYGILAGITYTITMALMVIYGIKISINSDYKTGVFLMCIIPAYFVVSMLEVVFLPYNVGVGMIMIFALCPLFGYKSKNKKQVKMMENLQNHYDMVN